MAEIAGIEAKESKNGGYLRATAHVSSMGVFRKFLHNCFKNSTITKMSDSSNKKSCNNFKSRKFFDSKKL